MKITSEKVGPTPCAKLRRTATPTLVRLLRRDKLCSVRDHKPEPGFSADWMNTGSSWTCTYSPSYDDDWHNDVVCTNGSEFERPYLREWDSFVTEAEIMESAREHERQLNNGG